MRKRWQKTFSALAHHRSPSGVAHRQSLGRSFTRVPKSLQGVLNYAPSGLAKYIKLANLVTSRTNQFAEFTLRIAV